MEDQMAPTTVTLNGNSLNTCAASYRISVDSVLARYVGNSWASCLSLCVVAFASDFVTVLSMYAEHKHKLPA